MYVFGEINKSSTLIENNLVNYTQNLTSASKGIQSIKIVKDSISQSYWNSLNVLFYTSGSSQYGSEHKFGRPSSNLAIKSNVGEQFLTKYHGYPSSSLITIPSQYYGERIKQGTFELKDRNNEDNSGNKPIIIDDGYGNLYSTNAHHSQSINSLGITGSKSSSLNYVGNIFYDKGLAVITETGSWSGSVKYSDLATNFDLQFDSFNSITTYEYNVTLLPQDYNLTTNYTIRNVLSTDSNPLDLGTPFVAKEFTGSAFQPYITTINLYQEDDYDTPVIQATFPRPIRKSDQLNMRFKIKLDI